MVDSVALIALKALIGEGKFHHATYREHGSIWEGLYIYQKAEPSEGGFRGYKPYMTFHKSSADLEVAYDLVRASGVSFGAYGAG